MQGPVPLRQRAHPASATSPGLAYLIENVTSRRSATPDGLEDKKMPSAPDANLPFPTANSPNNHSKMEACCTCARLLTAVPLYSEKSEKLIPQDRRLECCGRTICGDCLLVRPPFPTTTPPCAMLTRVFQKNTRFQTYCPYCQITSTPSLLPQGLKEPPSYSSLPPNPSATLLPTSSDSPPPYTSLPPSYSPSPQQPQLSEKQQTPPQQQEPILHFLNHAHDTLPSLSLAYSVPISSIRSLNRLTSDHLLAARKTILIPISPPSSSSSSSSGTSSATPAVVSLSPVPVEGEEEELRKNKIRRWMVATKIADYDVAVLYLEQSAYNLAQAVARFLEDEAWEREHPLDARRRGKGKGVLRMGGAWTGQARS